MANHTAARQAALLTSQAERTKMASDLLHRALEAIDHFTADVYIDAARAVFGTGLMGEKYDDDWRTLSKHARQHRHMLSDFYTLDARQRQRDAIAESNAALDAERESLLSLAPMSSMLKR